MRRQPDDSSTPAHASIRQKPGTTLLVASTGRTPIRRTNEDDPQRSSWLDKILRTKRKMEASYA